MVYSRMMRSNKESLERRGSIVFAHILLLVVEVGIISL